MPFALMEATAVYDSLNNRIKVYGGLKADSTVNEEVLVYQWSSTSIEKTDEQPETFQLSQNYPNPFNPSTVISYHVESPCRVTLKVFDIRGRFVRTLVDKYRQTGDYGAVFDAEGLPSRLYVCAVQMGHYKAVRKMVKVK